MTKKKVRKSKGEIEGDLCDLLSGSPPAELKKKAPEFPFEFLVVRANDDTAPILLRKIEREAQIVSVDFAAGYLRQYLVRLGRGLEAYNVPFETCVRVIKAWSHQITHLAELPKAVAFKSDPELAMTRLPFDPVVPAAGALPSVAPCFAGMLARITSNQEAFAMRIGSLYDPRADRKQAIWMSGPPDCGKSQFAWLIEVLVGGSVGILGQTDLDNSWWKAQLVGKRAGVIHEAPAKFIRSDAFKAITGDSKHSINQKNQKIYVARIDAVVFCFSNDAPEIPHDDALIRRIIDCRITSVPGDEQMPEADFRERLTAELPYIAGHCIESYAKLASGARIPCQTDDLAETTGRFESDYLDFLEHNFILIPAADLPSDECERPYVLRSRLRELIEERFGKDTHVQRICKRILKNRWFLEEKRMSFRTVEGDSGTPRFKRLYVYIGMREREEREKQFTGNKGEKQAPMRRPGLELVLVRPDGGS